MSWLTGVALLIAGLAAVEHARGARWIQSSDEPPTPGRGPAASPAREKAPAPPSPSAPSPAADEDATTRQDEATGEEHPVDPGATGADKDEVAPAAGDEVIVRRKDGTQLEGTFLRQVQGVEGGPVEIVVRVSGVEVVVRMTEVESVTVLDSPMARYRQMRALIKDDDAAGLLTLSNWLIRRKLYDQALIEIERVLRVDPRNEEAISLKRVAEGLILLEERAGKKKYEAPERPSDEEPSERAPRRAARSAFPVLAPEQINLIKVYEIDLKDPPRIVLKRETVEKLIRNYAGHTLIPTTKEGKEALLGRSPLQVLDIMFRVKARDLYGEVQVIGNPRSMEMFRTEVHSGWLLNSAASNRCHGGDGAGRLRLRNEAPNSDATVYTNFYILDRFQTSFGKPLIDYDTPEDSLLLQMALPREDVIYPHPEVQGWRPVFRSRDAPKYKATLEWIRSMYRPRPEYPIDYVPPAPFSPPEPGSEEPVER